MSLYVDGYVVPMPKAKVARYRAIAKKMSKVFIEHGALEYRECAGDDLDIGFGTPFPKQLKAKANETVFFSWIVFKSKADRNRVNAKVMKDPRCAAICGDKAMPFNPQRMLVGGFKMVVQA